MGTRKGLYGRSHRPADPGISPNEYVGAITAELRVHFPPNTDQELVTEAIDEALADALNQLTEHVEAVVAAERQRAERRMADLLRTQPPANAPSETCALDGHDWYRCAPENEECRRCGATR